MKKILPLAFFLFCCGPADDPHAGYDQTAENEAHEGHDHAAADEATTHPSGAGHEGESIHVEPSHVEEWGLEIGRPDRTEVQGEIELPGVLTTNENRTSRISSLVEGQIANIVVDLGTRVRAGQTLASLNAPEFTRAQAEFFRAYAQAKLSQKDYERSIILRDRKAIEEREFLRRESLVEQHLAELRSAKVILRSFGMEESRLQAMSATISADAPLDDHSTVESLLPIRSPTGGVVIHRDAILGDHINPDQILFTVSDLSVLWARLDAYEQQIPYLDADAEVTIKSHLLPGRTFPGKITFIADQVDPELRTVRVRVEVSNPDGLLRPNMYVQGFLKVTSPGTERFILPVDAVQFHEGRHAVFVQQPPVPGEDHVVFEMRDVEVVQTLSDGIIIMGGLNGSEQVVKVGAFTLKAEMTKGAGGHSHAH
jgi:cobalt-zinc-cadmium efflux system membrane fusion protein